MTLRSCSPKKQHRTYLSAFQPIVTPASRSTVSINVSGTIVALGTVIDAAGGIVTKATEATGGRLRCSRSQADCWSELLDFRARPRGDRSHRELREWCRHQRRRLCLDGRAQSLGEFRTADSNTYFPGWTGGHRAATRRQLRCRRRPVEDHRDGRLAPRQAGLAADLGVVTAPHGLGAVVRKVKAQSAGEGAGLRTGDVIVALRQKAVTHYSLSDELGAVRLGRRSC